jgi:diguanylate cyclase (GGDEF)-like protein
MHILAPELANVPRAAGPAAELLLLDLRDDLLERQVERLAEVGYRPLLARHLAEGLATLRERTPDLIVLSPLTRVGSAELEVIGRARKALGGLPLLVVSDAGESERLMEALRHAGPRGWDLVDRAAGSGEWQLRIGRLLEEHRLQREMDELRHRAAHDDRTDLLRPSAFQERLVEHFSAAQRHRFELALVMVDLDGFGQINKLHDHMVGDLLISQVGEVVRRNLRTEDVAGRLGGDEFAVLLPYTRKQDAARVVERLRTELHKLSGRPMGARRDIRVSGSIGYETFDGTDLPNLEELRRHAERALRRAKERGGNCAIYYRMLAEEAGERSVRAEPEDELKAD